MAKFTLPPSPNWQLSNVLSSNDAGVVAYGSRGELNIIKVEGEKSFKVSVLALAHKEKLNVVTFSPSSGSFKNCIATGGDDAVVRVWDFLKNISLYFHSGHNDGVKVMGLDWSPADTNRIVSVNDLGSIVCWDLASNTIRKLHCGVKVLPLCLSCCPHDKDIIAIGCKGGITLVIDIKGAGKILHRLRSHDMDVISLAWCPVPYNVLKHKKPSNSAGGGDQVNGESVKEPIEEKKRELLLATGGMDKSIFIWRVGSDGRYEVILNLPYSNISSTFPKKKVIPGSSATMTWICVRWVDAYTLLSSSLFGELLSWDLNKFDSAKGKKLQPHLLHSRHNKGLFTIGCPIVYGVVEDWKAEKRVVWTTAMDKRMVASNLSTGKITFDIPTLGGGVYSMAISPLDPNRLAIGSSDSKVFVWNTSDLSALNITTYWRKIIGKVMALAWHPTEENWLTYGTGDGHVGLIDVGANKPPTQFRLHHRKAVYKLCWAPPLLKQGVPDEKLVLFTVGDGDIFQFVGNPEKPDEEPQSLNAACLKSFDLSLGLTKTLGRSDFAFKPDLTCFAVANENGSVYIVECQTLKLLHTIYPHKKIMNNLEWHPETVSTDNSLSPYRHWLAISCDDIKVYNIPPGGQPEAVATLSGHSMKIVGLAWSPHYNARLLSASYDYTVQIWNVKSQSCVGVYDSHVNAVMCALFSPQDPDGVISGSMDTTIHFWPTSQLSAPAAKPIGKKNRLDQLRKHTTEAREATELLVGMCEVQAQYKKDSNKKERPVNGSKQPSPDTSLDSSLERVVAQEDYRKRQKSKLMFPVTSTALYSAKHFDMLYQKWLAAQSGTSSSPSFPSPDPQIGEETPSVSELGYLDFFGDDKAMQRLLMVEESHMTQIKHFGQAQNSALWRGDVTQLVREAIAKKNMSEWLVSIAPVAGFDVWEEASDAYAAQLVEMGFVSKASTYLLATHKVHEAVSLLSDHKLFREAVAVAKCRLPADDPLTSQVYSAWGEEMKHSGNLHLAAHCFLAAKDVQTCIEALSRTKDLKSLKMAALMARQVGKTELAESLTVECLTRSILASNFIIAHELIAEMPQHKYWSVWVKASECLAKVKSRSAQELLQWLEGQKPGLFNLLDELTATCTALGPVYQKLLPHLRTNKSPEFERDMWLCVSGELALACAARLEATPVLFLRHLVLAFSAAYHFQTNHPRSLALPFTLSLITPSGLLSKGNVLWATYESEVEKQLASSLKGFVGGSILHWMMNNWNEIEKLLPTTTGESPSVIAGPSTENGSRDALDTKPIKFDWLPELLSNCTKELLDSENVSFFEKKSQKQVLQEVVAKKQIEIKQSDKKKASKKSESKKKTQSLKDKCANEQVGEEKEKNGAKKVDENLNVTTESSGAQTKEVSSESEPKILELKAKKTKENDPKTKQNKPDNIPSGEKPETIKPGSEATKTKDEKSPQSASNQLVNDKVVENGSAEEIVDEDLNGKLKTIKELDEALHNFEAKRVAVPNPLTAYTNMTFLIANVVSKQDSKLAQTLQETCDQLWGKSHQ